MDQDNAAVKQQTALSPVLLAEIRTNPEFLRGMNRQMFAVHAQVIHQYLRDNQVPVRVRMDFMELLGKYGDIAPRPAAGQSSGAGFSISINLPSTSMGPVNQAKLEVIENPAQVTA